MCVYTVWAADLGNNVMLLLDGSQDSSTPKCCIRAQMADMPATETVKASSVLGSDVKAADITTPCAAA